MYQEEAKRTAFYQGAAMTSPSTLGQEQLVGSDIRQTLTGEIRSKLMQLNNLAQGIQKSQSDFLVRFYGDGKPNDAKESSKPMNGGIRGVEQELELLQIQLESIYQQTTKLNEIA